MTHIEKDLEKRYWRSVNSEAQREKSTVNREMVPKTPHANKSGTVSSSTTVPDLDMITLPILLRNRYLQAIVDTRSTLSLIQESWRQLKDHELWKPCNGQFSASKWPKPDSFRCDWECELHGKPFKLTLYVMRDTDLTVPSGYRLLD